MRRFPSSGKGRMVFAMTTIALPGQPDITLGILAGGRATRLGGADKAWLVRGGLPQVLRWQRRFEHEVATTLVSANRDPERYARAGLRVIADRITGDIGPMAGLDALLAHCETPWLLTLPVDLLGVNECLLPSLAAAVREGNGAGAFARDDDGVQPLVALWQVPASRAAVEEGLAAADHSIQRVQHALAMGEAHFTGVRFGNLNTPEDLGAAGIEEP